MPLHGEKAARAEVFVAMSGFARGAAGSPRSLDLLRKSPPRRGGSDIDFAVFYILPPAQVLRLGQNGDATKSGLLPLARGRFTRALPRPALCR